MLITVQQFARPFPSAGYGLQICWVAPIFFSVETQHKHIPREIYATRVSDCLMGFKYIRTLSCCVSVRDTHIIHLLSSLHQELVLEVFFLETELAGTGDKIWFVHLPWDFGQIIGPSIPHTL